MADGGRENIINLKMTGSLNLQRFLEAQQNSYDRAMSEIKNGKKETHWMWYIFPQIKGLGHSTTAKFYAIQNVHEAQHYLNHPILGKRLIESCQTILLLKDTNPHNIFGSPDDQKLKSSMTLFSLASSTETIFDEVLKHFFLGEKDERTIGLVRP